jgi:hypothetical protein
MVFDNILIVVLNDHHLHYKNTINLLCALSLLMASHQFDQIYCIQLNETNFILINFNRIVHLTHAMQ